MEQTHDTVPRPTFDKAWKRDQYHRELREKEERLRREANDWARRARNGRDKAGEVIQPEHLDPRAAEPPTTEDEILATYRITAWEEQNKAIRRLQDNVRKKVSAHGGHYIKPRVWTPKERAALMRWRNTYGMTPTGTGVGGRVNPGYGTSK